MPTAAELQVRVTTQGVQQASAQLQGLGRSVDLTGQGAATAGGRFNSLKQGIGGLSPVALGAAGAVTGVGFALKSTVDAAISWESALAGVAKTVDGTDAEIQALGDALRNMAMEIPIAATELAGIAEQAGALGIAKDDILAFTEVAATIGVTTDVSSEQAATALGQLSNVLGLTQEDYERFGSTLVDLGNKGASTESAILAMAARAGAGAELIGFATEETLAWSSALANLGIEAEAGGSSLQTFFLESAKIVADAGEELRIMAETAGMAQGAFANLFQQDASAALQAFINGLGELDQAARLAVLSALDFNDIRIRRALLGLSGDTDNLASSLHTAEDAWRENSAMAEEASKRYETTASQLQLVKNQITDNAITLGTELSPAFLTLAKATGVAVAWLTDFAINLKDVLGIAKDTIETTEENRSHTEAWGAALRLASGSSKDLRGDLGLLWQDFREGGTVVPQATEEVQKFADEILRIVGEFGTRNELNARNMPIIEPMLFGGNVAEDFSTQMDALRDISFHATQEMRANWEAQFAAMGQAVALVPETAKDFIDELVVAFGDGQASIEQVWSIIGQMPQDELIPALQDVRAEWLTTVAEMGDADEVRQANRNLAAMDEILQALGISLDGVRERVDTFGEVQGIFQQFVDAASSRVGIWQGHLSGAEEALGFLQDKIDAGIPLTEEQARQYDTLTWATERYQGGIEDEAKTLIDAEVAKADYVLAQDELNAAIERGEEDLTPYIQGLRDATAELDPATAASLGLTEAQGLLAEGLDASIEKLVRLLVELGILDETEAEAIIGADITDAEENVDHMEHRLDTYEGTTYTTTLDADNSAALAAIEAIRAYAANNPINVPIHGVVAGGNDMVTYSPGGAGGNPGTAGMGDQNALRNQSALWGEEVGHGFIVGYGDVVTPGAGAIIGADFGGGIMDGVVQELDPIAVEALLPSAEEFADYIARLWAQASASVQAEFTSESGLIGIMTGESQATLQQDIAALEAYMQALVDAGFGPGSEPYQQALEAQQALMAELALMNEIAGTEAAEAFWREYLDSLPLEEIGVAIHEIGDLPAWHAAAIISGETFGAAFMEVYLGLIEDEMDGEMSALPWEEVGFDAGKAYAGGFVEGASPIIGDGVKNIFDDVLDGGQDPIVELGEEGLAALVEIFTKYPDVAEDMIDDVLQAVVDGRIPFEDAMALLALVPEKDLIPALEALREDTLADLAQAMLEYGPDSPQVQSILASLGLIDAALGDVTDSAAEANAALDNLPGSKNYVAPGDQSPDGTGGPSQDTAGVLSGSNIPAELALLAIDDAGFARKLTATPANIAGIDPSDWLASIDGLATVKTYPALSKWGGGEVQEVNALIAALGAGTGVGFAGGGFTLGEGLALLHPNEAVLNPSSQMLQPLADAIVGAIHERGGGVMQITMPVYLDGQEIARHTTRHTVAEIDRMFANA